MFFEQLYLRLARTAAEGAGDCTFLRFYYFLHLFSDPNLVCFRHLFLIPFLGGPSGAGHIPSARSLIPLMELGGTLPFFPPRGVRNPESGGVKRPFSPKMRFKNPSKNNQK